MGRFTASATASCSPWRRTSCRRVASSIAATSSTGAVSRGTTAVSSPPTRCRMRRATSSVTRALSLRTCWPATCIFTLGRIRCWSTSSCSTAASTPPFTAAPDRALAVIGGRSVAGLPGLRANDAQIAGRDIVGGHPRGSVEDRHGLLDGIRLSRRLKAHDQSHQVVAGTIDSDWLKVSTVGLDPYRSPLHFRRNGDAYPVLGHPGESSRDQ